MSVIYPNQLDKKIIFKWLQTHKPIDICNLELSTTFSIYTVANEILSFFGLTFISYLDSEIKDQNLRFALRSLKSVYVEIQNALLESHNCFSEEFFPKTFELFKEICSSALYHFDYFNELKLLSYQILSFPERAYTYKLHDRSIIEQMQKKRSDGVKILYRILTNYTQFQRFEPIKDKLLGPLECVKCHEFVKNLLANRICENCFDDQKILQRTLFQNEEEEILLSSLYWQTGAVIQDGKERSFSELLEDWATLCPSNRDALTHIKAMLSLSNWGHRALESKCRWLQLQSFREYLIKSCLLEFEKNLGFSFYPSTHEILKKRLLDDEVCFNLSFFGSNLQSLFTIDLTEFKEEIQDLFKKIKLFFNLVEILEIELERAPKLFHMCLESSNKDFNAFLDKSLLIERSSICWHHLDKYHLLHGVDCLELFLYLCNRIDFDVLLTFIEKISLLKLVTIQPKSLLDFFKKNTNATVKDYQSLISTYSLLVEHARHLHKLEEIFIEEPIDLLQDQMILIDSEKNTIDCTQLYLKHHLILTTHSLRSYLYNPLKELFAFLPFFKKLKILKKKEECIDAYMKEHKYIHPKSSIDATTQKALEIVFKIDRSYLFEEVEKFTLFVSLCQKIAQGEEEKIQMMDNLIFQLESFCPSISYEVVYFLYRNLPSFKMEDFRQIQIMKDIYKQQDLTKFILPQDLVLKIWENIQIFTNSICKENEQSAKVKSLLEMSLILSFFPPTQPLLDYFRITGIDENEGIKWGYDYLIGHLGQSKSVFKNSSKSVYVHWDIINEKPTLFFSFFNAKTGVASSKSIALEMIDPTILNARAIRRMVRDKKVVSDSFKEIKRRDFFGYLFKMSPVFKEEVDSTLQEDSNDPQKFISCFDGLEGDLSPFEVDELQKKALWKFVQDVKTSYRSLYILDPAIDLTKSSNEIASEGCIYLVKNEQSLLPEALAKKEKHFVCYSSNLSFDCIELLRAKFMKKTNGIQDGFEIKIFDGKRERNILVSYSVQTIFDLLGDKKMDKEHPLTDEQMQLSIVKLHLQNGQNIPLQYLFSTLLDRDLFSKEIQRHVLYLKAKIYSGLISDNFPPG